MKRNILNEIIDKAIDVNISTRNRNFRLYVTPKVFKKLNAAANGYCTYRKSRVPKSNGDTDYGVKIFTIMGLNFYVSIDDTIKDFGLTKIDGKI